MAKVRKKVTSPKRRTAKDFMPNVIDLGNGITMPARLRIGGMEYLEDKYDCPLQKIPFQGGKIRPVIDLLIAMLMGEYPEKPIGELEAIVRQVDLADLQTFSKTLSGAITTQTADMPKKNETTAPSPS